MKRWLSALTPQGWAIAGGLLLVALVAAWWLVTEPGRRKARETAWRVESALSGSHGQSAREATEIIVNSAARDAVGDQLTRENSDEIRSASGSNQPVDPALRDAGLRGLCRRPAYLGDPRCVQYTRSIKP